MDLYFSLINTLCTAGPGFSRDYAGALSISDELYSPIMCNGNSMDTVIFLNMRGAWSVWLCCVFTSVFYSLGDGELALCRQPVLILWPPPKLQHVGNKPFFSNPQTVQQSIGNYLSQSMGRPFYFSLSPALQLSYLYLSSKQPSLTLLLLIPSVSFFAVSLFFAPTPSLTPPPLLLAFPPALSAPQHLL